MKNDVPVTAAGCVEQASPRASGSPAHRTWAITTYFNPFGSRRRLANYRVFRARLPLPLLTVEWSPDGRYELDDSAADVLLRVEGGDLMWQKERLLNVAVRSLPASCEHVAWVDADVVFERDAIDRAIERALRSFELVQLYDRCAYCGSDAVAHGDAVDVDVDLERLAGAVAHERAGIVASGDAPRLATAEKPFRDVGLPGVARAVGFAWAARRSFLLEHPFLEHWIVGGGDRAYLDAVRGDIVETVARHRLSPAHRAAYERASAPIAAAAAGRFGYIEGRIFSLWHGREEDRRYMKRHEILERHAFDPETFIRSAPGGAWAWASAPQAMRDEVAAYLRGRNDDGERV